jgi:hypothetical protein
MTMAMRVVGKEEGKGNKAMALATRVAKERMATATKRAMVTKTREAGRKEGNDKDGKSDRLARKKAMASDNNDNHDNSDGSNNNNDHNDMALMTMMTMTMLTKTTKTMRMTTMMATKKTVMMTMATTVLAMATTTKMTTTITDDYDN